MPPTTPLNVRVVVKLPYNRPEDGLSNPAKIVWNQEKADILWKVIERSRSADSAGADWKGLAEHLEVPLPYLLYRVNARFQEDIRGLRDIKGALSPTSTQEPSLLGGQSSSSKSTNPAASNATRVGGGGRTGTTPLSVRQRLNSLGNHALASARRKPMAASNATFQAVQAPITAPNPSTSYHHPLASSSSPPHSDNEEDGDDGTDSDGSDALREEEAEREAEEQETLGRKLAELQRMMTADTVGLVSNPRLRSGVDRGKGRQQQNQRQQLQDSRGRLTPVSPHSLSSSRMDALSSRSQSISSAGSPQGSIPDIPSQSSGSQPHSPVGRDYAGREYSGREYAGRDHTGSYTGREHTGGRDTSATGGRDTSARMPQPSSPPTRSSLAARSNSHGNRVKRGLGEFSSLSNQGSSASSFSDLSDASISASALESAFESNFGGSRLSQFNRSRRTHSVVPQ